MGGMMISLLLLYMTGKFGISFTRGFIVTDMKRYALGGAPYKINVFLDGADNFRGPESEGFVASIYNFSGSLDGSNCSNCQKQKEEGVKCISQVPATAPMLHRLQEMQTMDIKKDLKKHAPQPLYLALNGLGVVSIPILSFLDLRTLSNNILYSLCRWEIVFKWNFTDLQENSTATLSDPMSAIPCNMSLSSLEGKQLRLWTILHSPGSLSDEAIRGFYARDSPNLLFEANVCLVLS